MKALVQSEIQSTAPDHEEEGNEWSRATIVRLLVAAALLFTVYLLASLLPVDTAGMDFSVIGGFLVFWVLGGVFTITLLALSDRRS